MKTPLGKIVDVRPRSNCRTGCQMRRPGTHVLLYEMDENEKEVVVNTPLPVVRLGVVIM